MNVRPGSCWEMLVLLQDNSAPDCLPSSSALSVRSLKKVAYVGKAGCVVSSTAFFTLIGEEDLWPVTDCKPAFLSSVSKWKFCSFQGNILGWELWTHCNNSARWEAWNHSEGQNLAARRSIRNWHWSLSWTGPVRNPLCCAHLWGDAKPTTEY